MEALDGTQFTGGNVEWNSHGSTDLLEIDRGVEVFWVVLYIYISNYEYFFTILTHLYELLQTNEKKQ
jgi:hypothetical protein